jgi:hypothetical protein
MGARERVLHRLPPFRLVGPQVVACDEPASVFHQREQCVRESSDVHAPRPFFGQRLERRPQPWLQEPLARLQQTTAGRVDARAGVHRHHGGEHGQAGRVRRGKLDAVTREPEGGLDQPCPRQPAVLPVQQAEPGRKAGNAAGGRADRVVHQLGAERHLELHQLGVARRLPAEARHGDEAVEVPRPARGRVEVERVSAAE